MDCILLQFSLYYIHRISQLFIQLFLRNSRYFSLCIHKKTQEIQTLLLLPTNEPEFLS